MKTVEAILNGDTEEEQDNPDCYIHYADSTGIPEYIKRHEQNRLEAELQNLEIEAKYRAEPYESIME